MTGFGCFEGKCLQSCQIDKNCPSGFYCHLDHQICLKPCVSNIDCQYGYTCQDNKCFKNCGSMKDCGTKQYCNKYEN